MGTTRGTKRSSLPLTARRAKAGTFKLRSLAKQPVRSAGRRLLGSAAPSPVGSSGCFIGANRVVVRLPNGSPLICVANDLSLTPELATKGIYDRPFWSFLERVIRPGDHLVDVGANIGLFTVRMGQLAGRFGQVDAFEPDLQLADLVADNVQANWLNDKTNIHRVAVGSSGGVVQFYRHASLRALSTAVASGQKRTDVEDNFEMMTVPVHQLDDVVSPRIPIRLVKIDVEGAEAEVLNGMSRLLKAGSIRIVDLEVIRAVASEWMELVAWMRRLVAYHGASVYLLGDDGQPYAISLDEVIATAGHFPHVLFVMNKQYENGSLDW